MPDYHKKTPERAKYLSDYTKEWNKANTVCVGLRFSRTRDADILKMLDSVPARLDYIRQLIRDDMDTRGISFDDDEDDADE